MNLDHVEVNPAFKHWEELLKKWIELNKTIYMQAGKEYAAYSFRERPNVSVIAGAAVGSGWAALEECWVEKHRTSTPTRKYEGRADLLLWKGKYHERIEAKLTCDEFLPLKRKIKKRHQSSIESAVKLGKATKGRNVALTFIIPRVLATGKENFNTQILDLIEHCRGFSPSILSCTFPGWVPRLGGDHKENDRFSKGIIVIGDVV
ncbi:MAG: hypothetical protein EXR70_24935 [Deltaproteobacteria bacterium]|nr:hypothetical protein [Deltaproteobacteria bacterium]